MNTNNNIKRPIAIDFDPFSGPELKYVIPATEPQREIMAACLIGGADASRAYNESVSLHFSGLLHQPSLLLALSAVVARHDALRSAFSADGRNSCIFSEVPVVVNQEDISSLPTVEQQQYISAYKATDAETPFDLVYGPLFRFSLLHLADTEYYLTLTLHHSICDGWSLAVILQDISKIYNTLKKNEILALPPAPQFAKYAREQIAYMQSSNYADTEQYWLNEYKNSIPQLTLPTEVPRPKKRTYKSRRDDYAIDPALVAGIKRMGAKAGCSFINTLLAAFEVLMYRISGQNDIVIGLPAAAQAATGQYGLVGHCVNMLPVRSSPHGDITFAEYLKNRRPALLDDLEHKRITFGRLLQQLNIKRDPSRVPLIPVVFNIDMGFDDGVTFHELSHRLISNPRHYEAFEIFLNATGSGSSLVLEWSYNSHLFTPATIKGFMDAFVAIITNLIASPDAKLHDLLPSRPAGIAGANVHNIAAETFASITLSQLITEKAIQYPDQTAIRYNGANYTYRWLDETSNQMARLLQAQNVTTGSYVVIAVDRTADLLVALIAILKAGAAYIPIDPTYPASRIAYILDNAKATLLLTSARYKGHFSTSAKELLLEDALRDLKEFDDAPFTVHPTPECVAYAIYTSGSTGWPKGVAVAHGSVVNFLQSMQQEPGITPADRLLALTTISFDIAGLELYLPLITGATIVLADSETTRDGRLLLDMARNEKITIMQATPATWRMMLGAGGYDKLPIKALCGGERLPQDVALLLLEKCNSLWNLYGPTETTIWSAVKRITDADAISLGKPIANTNIYILNDALTEMPAGNTGELYIAGLGVAQGYLNNPELTAQRFIDDTIAGKGKMYRTGDLGTLLPNGDLQYKGRIDNQVKLRGFRIEPEEIEHQLLSLNTVEGAAVVVQNERLIAFIVTNELPAEGVTEAWKNALKQTLPHYMVPDEFVTINALPLTPNGKTDRNALDVLYTPAAFVSKTYEQPETEMEGLISKIWSELLHIPKIGRHDDFFELGGHSLDAVQVMAEIEQATGIRLPLATLFDAPTVAKLALLTVPNAAPVAWRSLVAIKPEGNKTPLYIVHGYGMNVLSFAGVARNMDESQPVYGLQARGADGTEEPQNKMEEIAGAYVHEILEQNPSGPYALAGYSFGGIIAFEMAKQLQAAGKQVIMLAMLDAYKHNTDYWDPPLIKLAKKARRQLPKFGFILNSVTKDPKTTIQYQSTLLKERLRQILPFLKNQETATVPADNSVNENFEIAYRHYRMTPYNGIIDIFRVKTRIYFLEDPIYLGWKKYAGRAIDIHEVTGDHKTFLMPPNDKEFATILQACIDKRSTQWEVR